MAVPVIGVAILLILLACAHDQPDTPPAMHLDTNTTLVAVDLHAEQQPPAIDGPLQIAAARNEWVSFTLQIQHLPEPPLGVSLRPQLQSLNASAAAQAASPPAGFSVYQVLPLPVDCRGADYVRRTGMATGLRDIPRALLPLAMKIGVVDLANLRDPRHAPVLWIDVHVSPMLPPGDYAGSCDLLAAGQAAPLATLPFALHVYDFTIPDQRHLKLVSQIPWDQLQRLYADPFETVTPRLLNRVDAKNAAAVKTLDDLLALAQANRVAAVIPRLQPTVKWPADQPPEVDWSDFDSMVAPWLNGDRFAGKTPLGYWPLPAIDYLDNYNTASRQQYWSAATAHFQQQNWLTRTAPATTQPARYSAGGDETAVRLSAWQAMLQSNDLMLFPSPLPNQANPTQPADPGELIWFYPGTWFGVEGSIPSIQLKWLRRAEQDYEYFYLASQRRLALSARQIARSMANAVELPPGQDADPIYTLFGGDVDNHAWAQARELLARAVLAPPGDEKFNLDLLRWLEPRQNHVILPRATQWWWDASAPPDQNWANLKLGVDVYNGGEDRHEAEIRWQSAGPGWEFAPAPVSIGELPADSVQRATLPARINLNKLSAASRQPVHLMYVDTYTQKEYPAAAYLPVATCDRREAGLKLNDDLADWTTDDLLHDGPLVKFYSRPAIQHHQIEFADTPAQIYSAWAEENFYLAFKLGGITTGNTHHTNTPEYQLGRAWGEDLCEVLAQAVYADNTTGPVLHVICKPTGALAVERKTDSRAGTPWEPLEGAAIRYATDADKNIWTGELAIGWKSLAPGTHGPIKLLRFNFSQHRAATGASASWAGPIDSGRDDTCTGLLFLRELAAPGMHANP